MSNYNFQKINLIVTQWPSPGGEGAEIVYSLKNEPTLAQKVLDSIGEAGQIKRKIYQRRLPENPNKDYYYILRETGNLEPILIEYGFIDNVNDAQKLKNNLIDYAEAVVKAVSEYAGYQYFPTDNIIENKKYIVQKGDTLYSIAKKFNLTVENLKKMNNLVNNTITIGQTLYIDNNNLEVPNSPSLPEEEIYIVQKGDTLYSIGKKFNITVDELKLINNLNSNEIKIGQQLFLKQKQEASKPNVEYDSYIVKKGDSLWSISQKYNIIVNDLIKLNELDSITLQIGQELKVPKVELTNPNEEIYIVKKGDTLWSIAKEFDMTVSELKEINELKSNTLSIGQQLKIKRT